MAKYLIESSLLLVPVLTIAEPLAKIKNKNSRVFKEVDQGTKYWLKNRLMASKKKNDLEI